MRSHQMEVSTVRREYDIPVTVRAIENLGKEMMISAYIGEEFVRITVPDKVNGDYAALKELAKQKDAMLYVGLTPSCNIFDKQSGLNLTYGQ